LEPKKGQEIIGPTRVSWGRRQGDTRGADGRRAFAMGVSGKQFMCECEAFGVGMFEDRNDWDD
jgi:hypothetical protein